MDNYTIPGSFWLIDTITYPDGRVVEMPVLHNVIQTSFSKALAGLTSGKDTGAITRMEVGSGDPGWDAAPPPPAASTGETGLLVGIARSTALSGTDFAYLVVPPTIPETVSGPATSRVRATIVFGIGAANGVLREAALYAGTAATGTLGTGTLVNVFRHVAINKPTGAGDFQLTRQVILQF